MRTFSDTNEVKKFYDNEFSTFNKNGIIVMRIAGFTDAGGHTTLWNGDTKQFEDFKINGEINYLEKHYRVLDFQFWELI